MKRMTFTTKAAARKIQRIIDKAFSLPKPGVPLGGGYYDPIQTGADQWTKIKRVVIKIKDENGRVISKTPQNTWILISDEPIQSILNDNDLRSNLTNNQRQDLQDAITAQIEVNDDQDDLDDDDE